VAGSNIFYEEGGGGGTGFTGFVSNYAALPAAAAHTGELYYVLNSTGFLWSQRSGTYYSDGASWTRAGNVNLTVQDNELIIKDDIDTTKQLQFQLANISTATTRTLTMPDRDVILDNIKNNITTTDIPNNHIPISTGAVISSDSNFQFDGSAFTVVGSEIQIHQNSDDNVGAFLTILKSRAGDACEDEDIIGTIDFKFYDDAPEITEGIKLYAQIADITDGDEKANLFIDQMIDGSMTNAMRLIQGKLGLNNKEPSVELDVSGTINADTAYQLNGTDINTPGTLTSVAYLDQANVFIGGNQKINDMYKLVLGTGDDGQLYSSSDDVYIENATQDKDIIFRINDGGTNRNAFTIVGANTGVQGFGATASGNYSFSFGNGSTATATNAISIGQNADATGTDSLAIGGSSQSINSSTTALGYNSRAEGFGSLAIGYGATSTGSYTNAIGYYCQAQNSLGATAVGYYAKATGEGAFAVGRGASTLSYILSSSSGSFAAGYTGTGPGGVGVLQSTSFGSFANGYSVSGASGEDATIEATASGARAGGISTGAFNYPSGPYYPANIIASGGGSFAYGYARSGDILAKGHGSFSLGYAELGATIQAGESTGDYGAIAFGYGDTQALGRCSVAMGEDVISSNAGDNIITLGENVTNTNDSSFGIGFGALDFLFDATNFSILQDNHKFLIGAGQDLELYHNATNSIIDNNTGEFQICDSATPRIRIDGTGLAFFNTAPVAKPTALTTQLTTITYTSPGTPDYAIQDLTNSGGYGFVTKDEGNTVLSVIANLQTRVGEIETKLQSLGLLT